MNTYFTVPFELGKVVVSTGSGGRVTGVEFDLKARYEERSSNSDLARQLHLYFEGREVQFNTDIDLSAVTAFRARVYERVRRIPYGKTLSYSQVASGVGSGSGSRAVGQAMARNRYPLLVPCHRVLSKGGGIGGFTSGVELKRYLLRLEGVDC